MKHNALGAALAVALASGAPAQVDEAQVTVFAAASLTTALAQIEAAFEAETGLDLVASLAGSSALARQVEQGAPADVVLLANPDWMDHLEAQGLLDPGTRRDLLRNTLVLVAAGAQARPTRLEDLPNRLGQGKLAMALVEAVPAGIYGKAALIQLGLWDALAPRVAQADNVRAALALVALGAAPFGVVYASDAKAEPRVSVVAEFPADSHPPIVYPVAALATRDTPAKAVFMDWLTGAKARAILTEHGFDVID